MGYLRKRVLIQWYKDNFGYHGEILSDSTDVFDKGDPCSISKDVIKDEYDTGHGIFIRIIGGIEYYFSHQDKKINGS